MKRVPRKSSAPAAKAEHPGTDAVDPLFPDASLEDRSRWLYYADIALREKVSVVLAQARIEQDAIKRKIRRQVEKFNQIRRIS